MAGFKQIFPILMSLPLLSVSACSELKVHRVASPTDIPIAGAPYQLSYTQFRIDVQHRLESCFDPGKRGELVTLTTKINSVEAIRKPDPSRIYVIDMESLDHVTKTSNLSVKYHPDGTLASINATATDNVRAAIESAVDTIVAVATGLAPDGDKVTTQSSEIETVQPGCTDEIRTIVDENIPHSRKELEEASKDLSSKLRAFNRIKNLVIPLGKLATNTHKAQLSEAVGELILAQDTQQKAYDKLEALLAKITSDKKIIWPSDGEIFSGGPYATLDRNLIIESGVSPLNLQQSTQVWAAVVNADDMIAETSVYLRIQPELSSYSAHSIDSTVSRELSPSDGFVYRFPAEGSLQVCVGTECSDGRVNNTSNQAAYREIAKGAYGQLGPVYALPLKSKAFSDRTINVAFEAGTGVLTELGTNNSSTADKAVGLTASVTSKAKAYLDSEAQKELLEVQAETKLLTARKELQDAKDALKPVPELEDPNVQTIEATNSILAENALQNARLESIKVHEELRKLSEATKSP